MRHLCAAAASVFIYKFRTLVAFVAEGARDTAEERETEVGERRERTETEVGVKAERGRPRHILIMEKVEIIYIFMYGQKYFNGNRNDTRRGQRIKSRENSRGIAKPFLRTNAQTDPKKRKVNNKCVHEKTEIHKKRDTSKRKRAREHAGKYVQS